MIDIKLIRTQPEVVKEAMRNRGIDLDLDSFLNLDRKKRDLTTDGDNLRKERNAVQEDIAKLKKGVAAGGAYKSGEDAMSEMKRLSSKIEANETEVEKVESQIGQFLLMVPNIPHESVPVGKKDETIEVRKEGTPEKTSKDVKAHWELGPELGLIDFERGVKVAGHRFTVLWDDAAALERALINFMMDTAKSRGYREIWVPNIVNEKTMTGTGQLPKFAAELYNLKGDHGKDSDMWLIPTSEVPLVGLHAGEVLKEKELPLNYASYTPAFRKEAGEYGKDIKGFLRQHQFDEIELVKFTTPEQSYEELEKMVKDAEEVLKLLGLPHRVVELTTGDLGFASTKTYDIEVWMPSYDRYREISSCSNCETFQARRANIKYWKAGKPEFVHTLNGTGVAVGRTLIAVFENYQQNDGSIKVPDVLVKYMGKETIEKFGR